MNQREAGRRPHEKATRISRLSPITRNTEEAEKAYMLLGEETHPFFSPAIKNFVFKSTLGDRCTIGPHAYIEGTILEPGTVVPRRAIIVNDQYLGRFQWV